MRPHPQPTQSLLHPDQSPLPAAAAAAAVFVAGAAWICGCWLAAIVSERTNGFRPILGHLLHLSHFHSAAVVCRYVAYVVVAAVVAAAGSLVSPGCFHEVHCGAAVAAAAAVCSFSPSFPCCCQFRLGVAAAPLNAAPAGSVAAAAAGHVALLLHPANSRKYMGTRQQSTSFQCNVQCHQGSIFLRQMTPADASVVLAGTAAGQVYEVHTHCLT